MCKGYSNKQPGRVLALDEDVANKMQAAIAAQEYGLPGDAQ